MRVAEDVRAAKEHLAELFVDEPISHIELEEVVVDEAKGVSKITLSFVRSELIPDLFPTRAQLDKNRSYKVVHVKNGKAGSVFDRILRPAEY